MKNTKQILAKKLILSLILVIMLGGFVIPNRVQADVGGTLTRPIFQFVSWLGDEALKFMQNIFIGEGEITEDKKTYNIKYSPGAIFNGDVLAFDVNFMNPKEEVAVTDGKQRLLIAEDSITKSAAHPSQDELEELEKNVLSKYGYKKENVRENIEYFFEGEKEWSWEYNNKTYYYKLTGSSSSTGMMSSYKYTIELYEGGGKIGSTAKELQGTVASWYKALRTFALVGLLSVLVYIGIRIIISSSSDDKAKYKKMLTNWVAAVCIVFVLHYIMVFILNISSSINDIFKVEVIDESGNDLIMSDLRTKMKDTDKQKDFTQIAGTTVCYLALVIFTGIFSVQYLKRVIYMAFLTMIAPLIALTYPLDKIKDGKAQAFSMWLKEYIFNALLQPIHLLLYYMLIGTAVDFAFNNPLYAVVATGFLIPAEKFFRKMFGMESQTSVGTIGAAAGGAMVMSMLNKMKAKPPKEEGEKQAKVRTADQNAGGAQPPAQAPAPAPTNPPRRTNPEPANQTPVNTLGDVAGGERTAPEDTNRGTEEAGRNRAPANGETPETGRTTNPTGASEAASQARTEAQTAAVAELNKRQRFKRAALAVGNKYIYGKDARKKAWRGARRTITGAVGGLAAGTIGLAAGVATGDGEKAFQYAAGGAAAGYIGASNLAESAWSGAKGMADTFNKGYKGTESYNNAQFDKQFFESDDYAMIAEDPQIAANGIDPKEAVQGYLSQGVTDGGQIRKLLQKGIDPETYKGYADVGMKDPDKIRELNKAHINATDYNNYVTEAHVRDIDKMKDLKAAQISAKDYKELDEAGISNINTIKKYKDKGKSVEQMKQMKKIAKLSKGILNNSDLSQIDEETGIPIAFKNFASTFTSDGALMKELWQNIEDFL